MIRSVNLEDSQWLGFPGARGSSVRDQHHPPVDGISSHPAETMDRGRPCFIGKTNLAVGGWEAGMPPAVWDSVGAVLKRGAQCNFAVGHLLCLTVPPIKLRLNT